MVKWQAFQDLGNIPLAQASFERCCELVQQKPLCNDLKLRSSLERHRSNSGILGYAEQLASLRQKEFDGKLVYRIPTFNIELCLPSDWKIDRESFSGDTLLTVFVPTATWDETAQCPIDASINVFYSTQHMELDVKSFGEMFLEITGNIGKAETVLIEGPRTFDEITFCGWNFKIAGSWPKEGFLMSFALPTARICIHVMCQTCGKHIFWPIFTSVAEAFTQKLINRAYSLPQS